MEDTTYAAVRGTDPHEEPDHQPPRRSCATTDDRTTIRSLRRALEHSREIGAAVGILMERHGLTYEDAWQRLRRASQDRNVPVRELAAELVLTGCLDGSAGAGNSTGADRQR